MMKSGKDILLRLEYNNTVLYEIRMDAITAPVTIGRGKDNLWQLPAADQSSSTHHARIVKKQKTLLLEDLNSRNGIYYLGQRIKGSIKLENAGVYGIGDCKLILEIQEAAQESTNKKEEFHRLEQLSGAEKGKIYTIKQPVLWIGSDRDCEIQIPDSMISRKHARIQNKPDGTCWICDGTEDGKGSRNGTKVNQTPVTTATTGGGRMLKDGDIVSVAYVDYRFWDKNVVHVRSNFFIKLLTVILTLAVVLGGYFGYQVLKEDTLYFYEKARTAAAAENFDLALQLLDQAAEAQGGKDEDRTYARAKLRASIKNAGGWQDTCDGWRQIEFDLTNNYAKQKDKIRNQLVVICDSNLERWEWSRQAKEERIKADAVKKLLLAMHWEGADSALDIQEFIQQKNKVKKQLDRPQINVYPALKADAAAHLAWLQGVITAYSELENALEEYKSLEKTKTFLAKLDKYSGTKQVNLIRQYAAPQKEIVACIDKYYTELKQECAKIANFDFERLTGWKVPLLFVESLKKPELNKNLKQRIEELQELMVMKENIARAMARYKKESEESYEAMLRLDQSGGYPYPQWLDAVFDIRNVRKMLACDVLEGSPLKDTQRNAQSMYDTFLGTKWFYEYLDGYGVNNVKGDRLLQRSKNFFAFAERVLNDTDPDDKKADSCKIWLLREILGVSKGENRLILFKRMLEKTREKRGEYLQNLEDIREDTANDRENLIAAGVILFLDEKNRDEKFKQDTISAFRKINRAVRNMDDNEKILKLGLPGNKKVDTAWKEKAQKK